MIKNLINLPMKVAISSTGDYVVCLVKYMIRVNGLIQEIIWEGDLLTDKSRYLALRSAFSCVHDKGILDRVWRKLEAYHTPLYLHLLKGFVKEYASWVSQVV